jgi:hypothetical protein
MLPFCLAAAVSGADVRSAGPQIQVMRVPGGGIQPDVAVDRAGLMHVVYLAGVPAAADVFHARSPDGGKTFTPPVRVNSQDGSAIATGTIRGAQMALGRDGRVHVAWNGSSTARPAALPNPVTGRAGAPMLYSRLNRDGTAFEPQRNLVTRTTDLDGGGSIAADDHGRVYVAWHGTPADGVGGESARQAWIARSIDDGGTFEREQAVSDRETGACGCCALRVFARPDGAAVHLLYRAATAGEQRDIFSLVSRDHGATFSGSRLQPWKIAACPMTSMSIAGGPQLLGAWETDGQVSFKALDTDAAAIAPAPGEPDSRRKHPRLASGRDGSVLMVWTEGTAWGRGGALAWQMFGADGRPAGEHGRLAGLPAWSFAAVAPSATGGFTILY